MKPGKSFDGAGCGLVVFLALVVPQILVRCH